MTQRAAVFAFVPEGQTLRNKRHVRIGRCSLAKPVRDRFHGMNTPKVILLDVAVDDPDETLDELKEIIRGFGVLVADVRFNRWLDFTECRYGSLWYETAYSLEALILFFEQIQKKFLGRNGDAQAVRAMIERERGRIEDVAANGDGALHDDARVPGDRQREFPLDNVANALREAASEAPVQVRQVREEGRIFVSIAQARQRQERREAEGLRALRQAAVAQAHDAVVQVQRAVSAVREAVAEAAVNEIVSGPAGNAS